MHVLKDEVDILETVPPLVLDLHDSSAVVRSTVVVLLDGVPIEAINQLLHSIVAHVDPESDKFMDELTISVGLRQAVQVALVLLAVLEEQHL